MSSHEVVSLHGDTSDEEGSEYGSSPPRKRLVEKVQDMQCSLTLVDLERFRLKYSIPQTIRLRLPTPNERACTPVPGEICFYEFALFSGLRFPIPTIIREILNHLNLAPTQLTPNAWRAMLGCMVLWRTFGNGSLTVAQFLHCYLPKKMGDWWYFSIRDKRNELITGKPSNHKKWKNRFFYVSGDDWEFSSHENLFFGGGKSIPRVWGDPNSSDFKFVPDASSHDLEKVLNAVDHGVSDFSMLVTAQALFVHGLGPKPAFESSCTKDGMLKKFSKRTLDQARESNDLPLTTPPKRKRESRIMTSGNIPVFDISHPPFRPSPRYVDSVSANIRDVTVQAGVSHPVVEPFTFGTSILDSPGFSFERTKEFLVKDDLARLNSHTSSEVAKTLLHDLGKCITRAVYLSSRVVEGEKSRHDELASLFTKHQGQIDAVTAELNAEKDARVKAEAIFQEEHTRAESLKSQVEGLTKEMALTRSSAVEEYKSSNNFKVAQARMYIDGFEAFRAQVISDFPDMNFSSIQLESDDEDDD